MDHCDIHFKDHRDDDEDEAPAPAQATELFNELFVDPRSASILYTIKESKSRLPPMETVKGKDIISSIQALGILSHFALTECSESLKKVESIIYGGTTIARVGDRIKVLANAEDSALDLASPESTPDVEVPIVMSLAFVSCCVGGDDGNLYYHHKIVATVKQSGKSTVIYRSHHPILALVEIQNCAVLVTSGELSTVKFYHEGFKFSTVGIDLKRRITSMRYESFEILSALLDETGPSPSLVCFVKCAGHSLIRIGKIDKLTNTMSEIHVKPIENLLWQNFSMYIEQARDSPEPYTMGVPGFALDGRGRIWIHCTRTLRIYDPDFELVDERETWSKLRIFNAVGGVQLHLLCDLRSNTAVEVGFASDDLEEVDEYWSDEH